MQTANIRKDQMVLLLDKTDFKTKNACSNCNTLQIMDRATIQQIKTETENLKHITRQVDLTKIHKAHCLKQQSTFFSYM